MVKKLIKKVKKGASPSKFKTGHFKTVKAKSSTGVHSPKTSTSQPPPAVPRAAVVQSPSQTSIQESVSGPEVKDVQHPDSSESENIAHAVPIPPDIKPVESLTEPGKLVYELKCQNCGIIGELDEFIEEFQCPQCGGIMTPYKREEISEQTHTDTSPVQTESKGDDDAPTISISREQIVEYKKNLKVAKAVDMGLGGMLSTSAGIFPPVGSTSKTIKTKTDNIVVQPVKPVAPSVSPSSTDSAPAKTVGAKKELTPSTGKPKLFGGEQKLQIEVTPAAASQISQAQNKTSPSAPDLKFIDHASVDSFVEKAEANMETAGTKQTKDEEFSHSPAYDSKQQEEFEKLRREITELKQSLLSERVNLQTSSEQIIKKEKELNEKEELLKAKEHELMLKERQFEEQKTDLEKAKEQLDHERKTFDDFKRREESLVSMEKERLTIAKEKLELEKTKISTEKAFIQTQKEEIEKEKESLRVQKEEFRKLRSQYDEKLKDFEIEKKEFEKLKNEYTEKIANLEKEIKTSKIKEETLLKEKEEAEKKRKHYEEKLGELEKEIDELKKQNKDTQSTDTEKSVSSEKSEYEDIDKELEALQKEIEALENEIK